MSDELKFGMDKAPSLLKWLTDLDNNPKSHTESWCDGWNAATNNLAQENADLTAKLKLAVEALYRADECGQLCSDCQESVDDALKQIGEQRWPTSRSRQ